MTPPAGARPLETLDQIIVELQRIATDVALLDDTGAGDCAKDLERVGGALLQAFAASLARPPMFGSPAPSLETPIAPKPRP